jgi:hypothetical protein
VGFGAEIHGPGIRNEIVYRALDLEATELVEERTIFLETSEKMVVRKKNLRYPPNSAKQVLALGQAGLGEQWANFRHFLPTVPQSSLRVICPHATLKLSSLRFRIFRSTRSLFNCSVCRSMLLRPARLNTPANQ